MRTARAAAVVTGLVLLLHAAQARADMGLPGFRKEEPRVRFDNLSDYPDYRFYLQHVPHSDRDALGKPLATVEITSGQVIDPHEALGTLLEVYLVAVPRSAPDPEAAARGWYTKDTPGVLGPTSVDTWKTSVFGLNPGHVVRPFRVEIRANGLNVIKGADESWIQAGRFRLPVWPVGLVVAALIACAGIWLVRSRRAARRRRAARPP